MQDVSYGNEWRNFLDAQYPLNPREIESIDETVYSVIYHEAVMQKFVPTINIGRGKTTHKVSIAQAPSAPIFSKDFLPEAMDKVAKKETEFKLVGISKDFFISMVDIDASRNSQYHKETIDSLHLREITRLIADYKERVLWRGYDILGANPGALDANVKGVMNTTGIGTFEAGIGLNDETGSAGDGPFSVSSGAQDLVTQGYRPPYDVILSPQLAGQFILNMNSTTHITDIERMQGMVDENGNKLIRKIHITPHLVNAAESGTNAAMAVIKMQTNAGEPTIQIAQSYPVEHHPINISSLGIQGKILWMGRAVVIRPKAITIAEAIDIDGVA